MTLLTIVLIGIGAAFVVLVLTKSLKYIGPTEIGLVTKRFGRQQPEPERERKPRRPPVVEPSVPPA